MCNDCTCFTAYKKLPMSIDIRLGDKTRVRATHQGTVGLGGIEINALHTSTFRVSLLSIGQLDNAGYTSTFRQGIYTIGAPGAGTIRGCRRGSIYVIDSVSPSECPPAAAYNSEAVARKSANDNPEAVAQKSANEKKRRRQRRSTLRLTPVSSMTPDAMMPDAMVPDATMPNAIMPDATMWHRRLVHLHSAALRTLVNGIRVTHDKRQCDVCVQAKHKQKFI